MHRHGVSADQLTLAGFALGVLAAAAIAFGMWALALALILANRVMDGLDGTVARLNGPTDRGAFLDIALDFVFYALVPLGFALHDPAANGQPAAILLAASSAPGRRSWPFPPSLPRRAFRRRIIRPRASTTWAD